MRRKVALQQAADSSDDEEGDFDDDDEEGGWGAAKKNYYADDGSGDAKKKKRKGGSKDKRAAELEEEDAREADEREAARLQREAAARLRASDFALAGEEDEEDEESEEDEEGEGATLGKQQKRSKKGKPAAALQALPRARAAGGGGASAGAAAAAAADAPALAALLSEMKDSLASASRVAGPLLADLREGEKGGSGGGLATRGGISFLEAKNVLLLQYSSLLAFYVALVAEGGRPADHPVVRRLVQARAFLEKARPIDKRLRYQVERLLAASAAAAAAARAAGEGGRERPLAASAAAADDDLAFAPRPGALLPRSGGGGAAAAGDKGDTGDADDGGIYRPPRLSAAPMAGADPTSAAPDPDDPRAASGLRKATREAQHQRRRAARSGFVRELAAELAGAPEELDDIGGGGGGGAGGGDAANSAAALRAKQALAARAAEEEALMTRVALSKDERRRLLSASRSSGLAGGALLDELTEDVAGLVGGEGGENPGAAPGLRGFDAHTVAQRYGGGTAGALGSNAGPSSSAAAALLRSGDALPPSRPGLAERRAAVDASKARAALKRSRREEEEDGGDSGPDGEGFDDDGEYLAVAARSRASKAARKAAFAAPAPHVPLARSDADGPRAITRDVEKNRGLTPHRRKDIKNPRVKGRKRFEKATVRRKGQVRDVAAGAAGAGYGGEATGVRSRLSKSVRFG